MRRFYTLLDTRNTYDPAMEGLEKHLVSNVIAERHEICQRAKRPDVTMFLALLCEPAAACEFSDTKEQMLHDILLIHRVHCQYVYETDSC